MLDRNGDTPAPALSRKPAKASDDCMQDVLHLLYAIQERLTCEEMEGKFQASDYYAWSLSTIQATCSWLRKGGALDNRADGKGRGFGLLNWDEDPSQEAAPE